MREINERFINDLQSKPLSFFLNKVKENRDKFSLEIRNGYVNIYFMGGNLLRIAQKKNGYRFFFDPKYCLNKGDDSHYETLGNLDPKSAEAYIAHFQIMQEEMKSWLEKHKKAEREFQHKLLVNNPSIIDIEYAPPKSKKTGEKHNARLDMLMIEDDRLIIVENKYGIKAIRGNAGLKDHYDDICKLLNTADLFEELLQSVRSISKAKYELGLLRKPVENIDPSKTEILFLLADYNEKSENLKSELSAIQITHPVGILKMDGSDTKINLNKVERI